MNNKLSAIIFILLATVIIADPIPATYTNQTGATLVKDILDMKYSPDNSLLVVLQDNHPSEFFVYDAKTFKLLQTVQIEPLLQPISLAFSPKSDALAIGTPVS